MYKNHRKSLHSRKLCFSVFLFVLILVAVGTIVSFLNQKNANAEGATDIIICKIGNGDENSNVSGAVLRFSGVDNETIFQEDQFRDLRNIRGVERNRYDDIIAASWTTDSQDCDVIHEVEDGEYRLEETAVPDGYRIADSITIVVEGGEVVDARGAFDYNANTVYMSDDRGASYFYVCKEDTLKNKIGGATFELTGSANGQIEFYSSSLQYGYTVPNGYNNFPRTNLRFTTVQNDCVSLLLEDGSYLLREVAAPDGYLAEEFTSSFSIVNGVAYNHQGSGTLSNNRITLVNRILGQKTICLKLNNGSGGGPFGSDTGVSGARLKIVGTYDGRTIDLSNVQISNTYSSTTTAEYAEYSTTTSCSTLTDLPEGDYTVTQETDGYPPNGGTNPATGGPLTYRKGSGGTFSIKKGMGDDDLTLYQYMRSFGQITTYYSDCSNTNHRTLSQTSRAYEIPEGGIPSGYVPIFDDPIIIPDYSLVSHQTISSYGYGSYAMEYCYEPSIGTLKITKIVSGTGASVNDIFDININFAPYGMDVTGDITSLDYQKSDSTSGTLTVTDNKATVSLKNEEWIELSVPTSYSYLVTESIASSEGYTVTYTDASGVTLGNTTKAAVVRNQKDSSVPTGINIKIPPIIFVMAGAIMSGFIIAIIGRVKYAKT